MKHALLAGLLLGFSVSVLADDVDGGRDPGEENAKYCWDQFLQQHRRGVDDESCVAHHNLAPQPSTADPSVSPAIDVFAPLPTFIEPPLPTIIAGPPDGSGEPRLNPPANRAPEPGTLALVGVGGAGRGQHSPAHAPLTAAA